MEIKFRAWVLKSKQLIQPCYAEIFKDGSFSGGDNYLNSTECILMQFTGLKDKNGKEIYSKDYLKNPKGEIGKVIYYEAGFYLECPRKNGTIIYIPLTKGFVQNKEILGNEFETPELIKDLQWK